MTRPPVNALGHALRLALTQAVETASLDPVIDAVVLTGSARAFSAGADIKEFGTPPQDPMLRHVIEVIVACPKPVVAAIEGVALGGGLELALGCDGRVAHPDARLGLPEVTLGIIPGAGGTQRLPRLVGVEAALPLIVEGKPLSGTNAAAMGLVDEVATDPVAAAIRLAGRLGKRGPSAGTPIAPQGIFETWREKATRKAKGLPAPLAAIDAIEAATIMAFEDGMRRERELFIACRDSEQSAAQRYLFQAERSAKKVPGLGPEVQSRALHHAGVIGCGTMGAGIAFALLMAGMTVTVRETTNAACAVGKAKLSSLIDGALTRGKLTADGAEAIAGRLHFTTAPEALGDTDMVIEAVFEDMAVKHQLFEELGRITRPGCVLATNTSSLDVGQIAAASGRPADVIGLHFFAPAHIMKLVEVVRGAETSVETLTTGLNLVQRLNKVGVTVGVCDGFVANRMYHRYTRQAYFLIEEGATPAQVDRALSSFGFAMGPFRVMDMSGLDVSYAVRQRQKAAGPPGQRWPVIPDRLVERGWLGRKTGRGWYDYTPDGGPAPNPALPDVLDDVSADIGQARRAVSDTEIEERCLLALVNEGADILGEGLVARQSDIDVVWRYGYGFPVAKGGPMFWARQKGEAWVRQCLLTWAREGQDALTPSANLSQIF